MKRFLPVVVLFITICQFSEAQLLSWNPQFPTDNSTITLTLDATKGNQGLLGHSGPVYLHLGVITNLSANASAWRYTASTWGTTTAPAATSLGNNKWSFTIPNPRTYFNAVAGGVPPGETILKIALIFRDASGAKAQRNTDGSDLYVPVYAAGGNHIQFVQPFITPSFSMPNEPVTASLGQQVPVSAIASTSAGSLNLYH